MTDDAELRERTKQTARLLFHSIGGGVGYETWRKFDRALARTEIGRASCRERV